MKKSPKNRNMPLLSIILPCYNVSKYINRCIESIYSQSIDYPIEVIAVNDASTDNTLDVLNDITKKFKSFKVISHKSNQKLTGARTTGMIAATGDYIMHVDPDDYLMPESLNSIFDDEDSWDVLMTNIIVNTPAKEYPRYRLEERLYDMSIPKDNEIITKEIIKGSCFAKIIKTNFFNNLIYNNYHYNLGEDRAFNAEVFSKVNIVKFKNINLYYYCYNEGSLDRDKRVRSEMINWENCWVRNIIDLYNRHKLSSSIIKYSRKEIERYSVGMLIKIKNDNNQDELLNHWKIYFRSQLSFFKHKKLWYKFLIMIPYFTVSYPLFLITPMNWDALKIKINKLLKL